LEVISDQIRVELANDVGIHLPSGSLLTRPSYAGHLSRGAVNPSRATHSARIKSARTIAQFHLRTLPSRLAAKFVWRQAQFIFRRLYQIPKAPRIYLLL
jgi:hypothetical protein